MTAPPSNAWRTSKLALDAGVAERMVAMAERYGSAIAAVLRGVFEDPELALSDEQRARLPDLLRRSGAQPARC